MTYDVILRKKQNKYIARVREWPEVVIEEETREAALVQIKQQLMAYLSQAPEVIPIEFDTNASAEHRIYFKSQGGPAIKSGPLALFARSNPPGMGA